MFLVLFLVTVSDSSNGSMEPGMRQNLREAAEKRLKLATAEAMYVKFGIGNIYTLLYYIHRIIENLMNKWMESEMHDDWDR